MSNISAVTDAIKKIPQLLSCVSQETWKTISAAAAGVIVSVGSVIAAYKFTHRKDQEETAAPLQMSPEDLKRTSKVLRSYLIEQISSSLDKLKTEGGFAIDSSTQKRVALTMLGFALDELPARMKAVEKKNSLSPTQKQAYIQLKQGIDLLNLSKRQKVERHSPQENEFFAKLPQDLTKLEELLTTFKKSFK